MQWFPRQGGIDQAVVLCHPMGETVARRPGLPKFLGDRVIHLRRLLLCHSPRLMGAWLALLRQFYAAEMFSCRVPGMMRQPPLERRARHPMQSCPSVLWPCFEQSSPYPEPTLMSRGVFFPCASEDSSSTAHQAYSLVEISARDFRVVSHGIRSTASPLR